MPSELARFGWAFFQARPLRFDCIGFMYCLCRPKRWAVSRVEMEEDMVKAIVGANW